jgi:two-component system LytT family response regulator
VIAEAGDSAGAIRVILEHKPDLIFLDVQMPGTDGFRILEEVAPVHLPAIIFVTAYARYAVRAFDKNAVDYLLKPFKQDRFLESLTRAKESILQRVGPGSREKLFSLLRQVAGDRDRFVIRVDGKIVFLKNSEVEWIEASANYVRVHAGQRIYLVRDKISDFEKSLDPGKFVRIHRSLIVNLDAVAEMQSCGGGEYMVFLRNGKELPLGRTYREVLGALAKNSR